MTDFFDFAMQSVIHFGGTLALLFWIAICVRVVTSGFEIKINRLNVESRDR